MVNFYGVSKSVQGEIEEIIESEFAGREFDVMSESQREKKVKEYIQESLWAFNASFILEHSNVKNNGRVEKSLRKMQEELCEDANDLIAAMITDIDEFVEDAIRYDGYGHFLSPYDGEENEIEVDGATYYVYRTN
jgi:hypothetical protein